MTQSPRRTLPIPLPVELSAKEGDGDGRFFGYLQNVSDSGAFVQSCAPRPPGTCVAIRIRLPGIASPVECPEAEVVWSRSYQGRGGPAPGMGVRLRRLPTPARAAIRRFCAIGDGGPKVAPASSEPLADASAGSTAPPGVPPVSSEAAEADEAGC